jgi:hypothetical protein
MADGTLKVGTITTSSGSGTITLGQSGETISVPSGATFSATAGTMSGQNYPAFEVNLGSDQSISSNTNTKVEFDTEIFDTNNYYDNSTNYRFTPQVAGKYFFYTNLRARATSLTQCVVYFYKNGSSYSSSFPYYDASQAQTIFGGYASAVVDLNGSTDYVEVYINIIGTSPLIQWGSTNRQSRFGGYRIGA